MANPLTKEQRAQAAADRLGDELREEGYRSPLHKFMVEQSDEKARIAAGGARED